MPRHPLTATASAIGLAVICAAGSAAASQASQSRDVPTNAAGQPLKTPGGEPLTYQKIEWLRAPSLPKPMQAEHPSRSAAPVVRPSWSWVAFGANIGGQGLVSTTVAGSTEIYATASSSTFGSGTYWYALTKSSTSLSDGLKQTFASEEFESGIVKLALAKIAGEERIVVVRQDGSFTQYDAATKQVREVGNTPCSSHSGQQAFATRDLNGDGVDEFISICSDNMLFAHGPSYTTWGLPNVGGTAIATGQMDDDAAIEIVTTSGKVIDSATRKVQWNRTKGFGRYLAVGDIDSDGRDELIAAESWYTVTAFNVETKSAKWNLQTDTEIAAIQLADITGDGVSELLLGDGQWGSVHAYDTTTRAEIGKLGNPEHGVTNILVADVNGDGVSELLWGAGATSTGSDRLYVANWISNPGIVWQNIDLTGPFVGPVAGDLDGDGVSEVVFASHGSDAGYGSGRIVVLDSRTLAVRAISPPVLDNKSWEGIQDIRLGDTDGDGRPEIMIAADHMYDGAMEAYKFTRKNAFVKTASIIDSNTRGFTRVAAADLDRDGTVEVLVGTGSVVSAYAPASGLVKWSSAVNGSADGLAIGDLDGDSIPEYVCLSTDGHTYVFDGITHANEATLDTVTGTAMSLVNRSTGTHLLMGAASGRVVEFAYQGGAYGVVADWLASDNSVNGVNSDAAGNTWIGSAGQLRLFNKQGLLRYESVPLGGVAGRQIVRVKSQGLDLTVGQQGLYGLTYGTR